ncbi:MAG: TauD/TfdA family dioxygenase [Betaproteobacteria bacterium]|nr:TauD/TfdA family dioxygenase [Betaproteobacteria bacterium]
MDATTETFGTVPLAESLACEIRGLDLATSLTGDHVGAIKAALDKYSIVIFRDQRITQQGQVDLAARLGPLRVPPIYKYGVDGMHPSLHLVSNVLHNDQQIGLADAGVFWHSDAAYMPRPVMYTLLYGVEIPHAADGRALGNTRFASMAAAYEALPDEIRTRIQGRRVIQSLRQKYEKKIAAGVLKRGPLTQEQYAKAPDRDQPMVRTHPNTGRKSLYISEGHSAGIVGMPNAEANALLAELCAFSTQSRFVYDHQWRVGDLVVWDNAATVHKATFDYKLPQRRLLHRCTVEGTEPF